ncbi:MAG: hypothetical protein IPJ21_07185 [Sterolibacteriaceae bacterium]|nr:hypothetical protein [Sterolibacteriaceae bacterium]MBK9087421.1 hypothetical protein [Sterolibacteriaceae bacterium]
MSAYVYCLYSNEDGVPRYVERVDSKVSYRFKEHVTAALEKEPGPLYDWMRDVWRRGGDVAAFTLQEGIIPKDHAMFEQYWIDQFADLLNFAGNRPDKTNSAVAKQVIAALQEQIEKARQG